MKEINQRYVEIVRENYEENLKSGKAVLEYMEGSTAVYHGVPVACLYMPKFFSSEAYECLKKAAKDICGILDKIIHRYLNDAEYRKLFSFPKELEDLILIEANYPRLLPIARLDIFFNEEDFSFKFCEFNTDGASAMNEDRELNKATVRSVAFKKLQEEYDIQPFELFDSWVREFMDIYASYNKKVESPRVVITDFMESATPNEFIEFKKAFQKAGYDADICEIRELQYSGGELRTADGKRVDVIYRRAVTRDIMEHINEVGPFIQAVRENAVCLIGHFRTQVVHNKILYMIMRLPETLAFLTEDEREYVLRHIPETFKLNSNADGFKLDEVLANKNDWIIKPEDLYASRGVFVGVDCEEAEWRKAVTDSLDTGYLLQRFCPPYRSVNLDFNGNERPDFLEYNNITGMFVYNGKLAGLYSRGGPKGKISSHSEGMTLLSLVAQKKGGTRH